MVGAKLDCATRGMRGTVGRVWWSVSLESASPKAQRTMCEWDRGLDALRSSSTMMKMEGRELRLELGREGDEGWSVRQLIRPVGYATRSCRPGRRSARRASRMERGRRQASDHFGYL